MEIVAHGRCRLQLPVAAAHHRRHHVAISLPDVVVDFPRFATVVFQGNLRAAIVVAEELNLGNAPAPRWPGPSRVALLVGGPRLHPAQAELRVARCGAPVPRPTADAVIALLVVEHEFLAVPVPQVDDRALPSDRGGLEDAHALHLSPDVAKIDPDVRFARIARTTPGAPVRIRVQNLSATLGGAHVGAHNPVGRHRARVWIAVAGNEDVAHEGGAEAVYRIVKTKLIHLPRLIHMDGVLDAPNGLAPGGPSLP
mmetsp:Transcript_21888/g.55137  ORF Transcript_21888/g.55137 Transcript_21888/m.55137 type:complete len:254 (-) Transcript_21888:4599-5360(-)